MNISITVQNDFMSEPSAFHNNSIIVVSKKNYIEHNARETV